MVAPCSAPVTDGRRSADSLVSGAFPRSLSSTSRTSAISVCAHRTERRVTPQFVAQYETYNCQISGCSLQQAGNPMKPETTAETELGTDLTLFNRLGVVFTYVDAKTKNQILPAPTPTVYGFSTQWQNAGTLASKTFETELESADRYAPRLQLEHEGTWDKTRTWISQLFVPQFVGAAGTGQGTGSFFLFTQNDSASCQQKAAFSGCLPSDKAALNTFGNIWGRAFYRGCDTLPSTVQIAVR